GCQSPRTVVQQGARSAAGRGWYLPGSERQRGRWVDRHRRLRGTLDRQGVEPELYVLDALGRRRDEREHDQGADEETMAEDGGNVLGNDERFRIGLHRCLDAGAAGPRFLQHEGAYRRLLAGGQADGGHADGWDPRRRAVATTTGREGRESGDRDHEPARRRPPPSAEGKISAGQEVGPPCARGRWVRARHTAGQPLERRGWIGHGYTSPEQSAESRTWHPSEQNRSSMSSTQS